MTMNYQDQLHLLLDILQNQYTENHGTNNEFEQIESLVNNLMSNDRVPENIKSALKGVEKFAYDNNKDGNQRDYFQTEVNSWVQQIQGLAEDNSVQDAPKWFM